MSLIEQLRNGVYQLDRQAILQAIELLRYNIKSDREQFIEEVETPPQVVQYVIETSLLPKAEEVCDLDSYTRTVSKASLRLMRSNQQLREQLARLGSGSGTKTIGQLGYTLNFALNELHSDIWKANSIDFSVLPLLFQRLGDAVSKLACASCGPVLKHQVVAIGYSLHSVRWYLYQVRYAVVYDCLTVPFECLEQDLLKYLAKKPDSSFSNDALFKGIGITAAECTTVKSGLQETKDLVISGRDCFGNTIDIIGRSCLSAFYSFSNRDSNLKDKITRMVNTHRLGKYHTGEALYYCKDQIDNVRKSLTELKNTLNNEAEGVYGAITTAFKAFAGSLAGLKITEGSAYSVQSEIFKNLERQQLEYNNLLIRYQQSIHYLRNAAEAFSNDLQENYPVNQIDYAVKKACLSFRSAERQLLTCYELQVHSAEVAKQAISTTSQLSCAVKYWRDAFKSTAEKHLGKLTLLYTAVRANAYIAQLTRSSQVDVGYLFSLKYSIYAQAGSVQHLFDQIASGVRKLSDKSGENLSLQRIRAYIRSFADSMTELIKNNLNSFETRSAAACLKLVYLDQALSEVINAALTYLKYKHLHSVTAFQKLQTEKYTADAANLAYIQAFKTQIENLQRKAETFGVGTQTDLDNYSATNEARRSTDRIFEQQPTVTILSLPKDPPPELFIQYFSQPRYDFDSIIYSAEELHPILVTTFKEMRSRKAITSRTNAMVCDAYKRVSAFFTEKEELYMLCTYFGIYFVDSDIFREAFRNFIISRYNVAMDAFFNKLLEMIFLDVVPSYYGAVKSEVKQLLGNLLYILLQMSLYNYKCAKVEAAPGKVIIFPKMVNDYAQSFDALQVDAKDLAK